MNATQAALQQVQLQLFGCIDAIRADAPRLSDREICERMWAIARTAREGGLAPAAEVARHAIQPGATRAGLAHSFASIEDAVRCGAEDRPATEQLLALIALRMAG